MKKVISILLTIMMISTTVLADTADDLQAVLEKNAEVLSFTSKTELSAKLNKPLEIFEDIPKDEYADIDYQTLIGDLVDSTAIVECTYNASDDYKKVQMGISVACDIPVHINDCLKVDAYAKYQWWYNYDVTDAENPKLEIITKSPINSYYEYGNYFEEYEDAVDTINPDLMKDAVSGLITALNDNAKVTKNAKGYKITLDNDGFNGFISDCVSMIDSYDLDQEFKEFLKEEISPLEFDFLGKGGITFTITENRNGEITACAEKIHLNFNAYDLAEELYLSTDGLTRENAQVDITFEAVTEVSGQNKTTVKLPELTDENSRNIYEPYHGGSYYYSKKSPLFKDNVIYYPIDEVISLASIDASVDGNKIVCGDEVYECTQAQYVIDNDQVYVTEEVLEFIGATYFDAVYDNESKKFGFDFLYEEGDDYYDDGYEPEYLYRSFSIDRVPYVDNGICYMPVFELMDELYEGEFAFGYKSLSYTVTNENSDGIGTFSVKHGDKFVTVNGERIELEAPAVEVDGVLNIPVSFVCGYGYSVSVSSNFSIRDGMDGYTMFYLEKANPSYIEEEYEPPYIEIHILSDQLPYVENDEVYIPIYDFLVSVDKGEFSFTENGFEYVTSTENDYGITKVTVSTGDNFVMVNDEKVELKNKVVTVNDIMRVPMEFVEALGFDTDYISVYDTGTEYLFSKDNPNYTE